MIDLGKLSGITLDEMISLKSSGKLATTLKKLLQEDGKNQEPSIHATLSKINFLKGKGFLFHLDDDVDELMEILKSGDSCAPLNVDHMSWKENCLELLNK